MTCRSHATRASGSEGARNRSTAFTLNPCRRAGRWAGGRSGSRTCQVASVCIVVLPVGMLVEVLRSQMIAYGVSSGSRRRCSTAMSWSSSGVRMMRGACPSISARSIPISSLDSGTRTTSPSVVRASIVRELMTPSLLHREGVLRHRCERPPLVVAHPGAEADRGDDDRGHGQPRQHGVRPEPFPVFPGAAPTPPHGRHGATRVRDFGHAHGPGQRPQGARPAHLRR